jgi:hypothetical protein
MQAQNTTSVVGHENLNRLSDKDVLHVVRNSIPVFVGERNSKGGLSFKCPYCGRKHHHKAGSGMRTPHCFVKPPLYTAGYYLMEPLNDDGVVTVEQIKRSKLETFLKGLGGKMFGIDYVKLDNTPRSLTGRFDVTAPLKGGKNKVEALDRPYITVYDIHAKGFRTVNLDTTKRVRVNGKVYDVVD